MNFSRTWILTIVFAAAALVTTAAGVAAPIKVGGYFLNVESTFTAAAQTYSAALNLSTTTALVVEAAPQYAMDFGIIPAADLAKWQTGQSVAFLFRLIGVTDVRYITLAAGSYAVVARDLNGGIVANGFAIKVRRFKGFAIDNGVKRPLLRNNVVASAVLPANWNGFRFRLPDNTKMWFEGVFSRGLDHKVHWEIVTEAEYPKFVANQPHQVVRTGGNPTRLGFEFSAVAGIYYFVVRNEGATYSSFAVTRELYR